jgi:transglutaminase-like putative cysteine protease
LASHVSIASHWDEAIIATTPQQRFQLGGGWWTFLLTLTLLMSMAGALYTAGWSEGLDLVQGAVIASATVGLLLALTRWSGLFGAIYSFVVSIPVLVTLLRWGFFPELSLQDAIINIIQRNNDWFVALINRGPAADNLIFVLQLCLLGWWIGHFAVWSLFRHQQVIHAIVPTGIGLLVVIYYSPLNLTGYLIVYLMAVVLLAMSVELARNQARWRIFQIRYAPDIFWDFLKAGLIFAVLVTAVAWAAPSLAGRATMERVLRPFDASWRRFEQTWSRMYKSLRYQGPPVRTSKFGKSMGLGGPVNLTDRLIFEAEVGRRSYWRGASFDFYTGQSWQNTDEDLIIVDRYQPLNEPPFTMYGEITATIRPLETGQDVIFAAPQALRVSVPVNAEASRVTRDGELNVSLLRSRVPIGRDAPYQVVSGLTMAPQEALRKAGDAYPPWVLDRFLQLPETFPDVVRQVAISVTKPFTNTFDQATAVEAYLRGFRYNLQVDASPPDVDAVEYFLFTSKEGYCDYYSSAMVTMLRAVGIPARMVVGYTPGEYLQPEQPEDLIMLPVSGIYRVLERNAHAWPEVYFPQYGWIQFEPTASEPLLIRPTTQNAASVGSTSHPPDRPNPDELDDLRPDRLGRAPGGPVNVDPPVIIWLRANWPKLAALFVALAVVGGGWLLLRWQRQTFYRRPELLARLFDVLGRWAARLRIPWVASQTPWERATAFNRAVPEAEPTVGRLARLFVAERYGREAPGQEALTGLIADWERLGPTLWKRWLRLQLANANRLRQTARRGNTPSLP